MKSRMPTLILSSVAWALQLSEQANSRTLSAEATGTVLGNHASIVLTDIFTIVDMWKGIV